MQLFKSSVCLPLLVMHLMTTLCVKVLLRLNGQAASVGLVLSALHKQASRLPVPYTQQQEEADQHGLCHCCTALAAFMKPFVEDAKRKDDEELKTELLEL
ncbi:hypothetical protein LDENG_00113100 [Lucifuga dentata]|nr:hypothetical protein LDENG_00113100 [Lucifuga dentata]